MTTAHSKVGASSAKRWMACPGSVRLCDGLPEQTSEYAAEGTRAHELAEMILSERTVDPSRVSAEMADAVVVYTEYVFKLMNNGADVSIERRFNLVDIHASLFGTADAVSWDEGAGVLEVIDYKHGAGVPVEVVDNPQLYYYALGALLETKHPAKRVKMTIVQPRCFHPDGPIRSVEIDALELLDWSADLKEAVLATEKPDAPLKAGDHCHWCKARGFCPELKGVAQATAKRAFAAGKYDPAELADTLSKLPMIENWIKGVRELAYGEVEHGRPIPGWKLVAKRANRAWRDEGEAVRSLKAYGLDERDIYDMKLLSPAQIEKVLGKDNKDVLEDLVTKESSGYALAPESDKRPAVKMDAKSEFASA